MNNFIVRTPLYLGLLAFLLTSCVSHRENSDQEVRPVTPVTVCGIRTGSMAEYSELTAISSFLVKSALKSPVSGYVEKCALAPGDKITKGALLFMLRTKEGTALKSDSLNNGIITGLVRVKATVDGVIASLDHPAGDYVQEGDVLCTSVLPESLVFLLELPFELKSFVKDGSSVQLILPDKESLEAKVREVLPSMSQNSQTQRVILQPKGTPNLPENLIARVKIAKSIRLSAVILPKACILSDEIMKEFWVMKLLNDTLAVKVPVTLGIMNADSSQILSPVFSPSDRFLSSGNYGIGDTAVVRIIK
ncbi:MAG: HlyD family efflux transporter periplasmic adaptor subunit [Bacteroidales bacterium]|nr:HlyD family efflux transporter periplasmic adaptor subunit [Bacteroidales bacterium]HNW74409.1 HlyD family efflux transporter periplasmic adaptor subunit [Bacteroidales bacterium]HPS51393.1 HlyD family efflux transporter periplasmic adaptor subunit [Bacteroidales bacterium]